MPRAPPVPGKPDLQLPNGPNPTTTTTTTTPQKKKFCLSKLHVSESEMKANLNWACKYGRVDCRPINPGGGECFDNSTLRSRAAWAMNSYYHGLGGGNDATCNFWGTAAIVDLDPSKYSTSFY